MAQEIQRDEIQDQIGNSLAAIGGWYARYCKHPEMVKRCMWIMLFESRRLVKKLEKIYPSLPEVWFILLSMENNLSGEVRYDVIMMTIWEGSNRSFEY